MAQLYQNEGPVDGATQHRARSAPCSESFLGRKCLTPALSTRHQMLRVLANILRTPAPRKATTSFAQLLLVIELLLLVPGAALLVLGALLFVLQPLLLPYS